MVILLVAMMYKHGVAHTKTVFTFITPCVVPGVRIGPLESLPVVPAFIGGRATVTFTHQKRRIKIQVVHINTNLTKF